ncbi:MAG TPA: hypothetical protein VM581_01580 [Magnetospirillaceae bacterium]|nr:hypothetical protein [Magnetospirillaceae bacterium]
MEALVSRKVKTDGKIEKLVNRLKNLIDEAAPKEAALKFRTLAGLTAKKVTVEKLLGKDYWTRLQTLLDDPEARIVLKQPATQAA